jgi:hypothetical protein
MAIKELFYDNRPQVLLDPRASQRIDPRFKFTRNTAATYIGLDGILKTAPASEPRFEYDYATGTLNGLLIQPSSTNKTKKSSQFDDNTAWTKEFVVVTADQVAAPDGTTTADKVAETSVLNSHYLYSNTAGATAGASYTMSAYVKRGSGKYVILADRGDQSWHVITFDFDTEAIVYSVNTNFSGVHKLANGWYRLYFNATRVGTQTTYGLALSGAVNPNNASVPSYQGDINRHFYAWGAQTEVGTELTSYIPTDSTEVSRDADLLSIEAPLPASGSVYIDARAITANENDTLLSLKNSSNDKIDLAYLSNTSTYNSLALIANYDGTSKSSLPLPVPTTNRERNIITWGANNYQYTRDSSRYAASLSSSVPTGLNQLSIGHDAVDPTKAFNGYINTVYAWSGELTPAVAEALVRNDLDPINADTYSPVGPAGSLALVINTQGSSTSGDKTFTLPAESAANDNDIVITWGDGTESALELAAAEVGAAGLTHTYPSAGIYPVWVEGKMQNIYFNNIANAPDLLQIAAWGTNANGSSVFRTPSTMANAFYGCTQMNFSTSARTTNLPDTSGVTDWSNAFRGCSSITGTFPAFNFSAATNLLAAWNGCSSLTAFTAAGDQTQNVTNFGSTWYNCSSLTSFPLINTAAGTNFSAAWFNCSNLTSFPLINTAAGTNFSAAWFNCSNLTSFPLINTAAGTNFAEAWYNCSSLTSFPLINTAAGTNFSGAWYNCSSLTSFPLINTSAGTNFNNAWYDCSGLTSFPLIATSAATSFVNAWRNCVGLTSFPLINTSAGTNFTNAWYNCSGLTSFPLIDTSAVTNFSSTWGNCSSLTSFPLVNTGSGTNFSQAWYNNDGLTSLPALDFDSATGLASDASNTYTGFRETWRSCGALAVFPANLFDNTTCTRYLDAFRDCALTAASLENILVSINAAGTSNGNLSLQGGTNAGASTWTANAVTAYNALVARGWTITRNA